MEMAENFMKALSESGPTTFRWWWSRLLMYVFAAIGSAVLFTVFVIVLSVWQQAFGREQYPGQYAQADPEQRNWFRNQISPKSGGNCCSEADGVYAEEDIRTDPVTGHTDYWARFTARKYKSDPNGNTPIDEEVPWMKVPWEVVLQTPNRNGTPVVWFYFDNGGWQIRCYAPGGKS